MRNACDRAFKDGGVFHYNAFYFKRTYAVAGRFYNVVFSADVPVIAVLIAPGDVARVIITAFPYFRGAFRVSVIFYKKSGGMFAVALSYNYFSVFTGSDRLTLVVDYINVKIRNGDIEGVYIVCVTFGSVKYGVHTITDDSDWPKPSISLRPVASLN